MKSRTLSATLLILLAPMIVSTFQAQTDQVRRTEFKSKSDQTGGAQPAKVTAKLLHTITEEAAQCSYWWSPDSKILAVKYVEKSSKVTVSLYDAATGKARAVIQVDGPPTEKGVYFTPNGGALVIHTDRVRLYDMADGKLLREFAEGTMPINLYYNIFQGHTETVTYSDGSSAEVDRGPSDKEELMELPTEYISDRIISPDGTSLLARAKEGKAQVYDLGTGGLKFTLEPFITPGNKKDMAGDALGEFSPDGRLIVTSHRNATPRLWSASTGDLIADLGPQSDTVFGVRFSHDSRFVATTSFAGIVKIWDATTGKLLHTIGSKKEPLYFAVWNPINSSFVTKSRKWYICVWNAETGGLVCALNKKAIKEEFDKNLTFEYSPDGKILLTKARGRSRIGVFWPLVNRPKMIAHLWDVQTGSLIASLRDSKGDSAIIDPDDDKFFWSPAGDFLITAGPWMKIWNRRGELMQDLDGNALVSAAFSPDGKHLAIAGYPHVTGPSVFAMVGKVLVGKLPKDEPIKTYVWQIEGAHL
jgi:WD40 repeat protein